MDVDEPGASPRLPPEPYHSLAEAPLGSPGTETTRCTNVQTWEATYTKSIIRPTDDRWTSMNPGRHHGCRQNHTTHWRRRCWAVPARKQRGTNVQKWKEATLSTYTNSVLGPTDCQATTIERKCGGGTATLTRVDNCHAPPFSFQRSVIIIFHRSYLVYAKKVCEGPDSNTVLVQK